VNYTNTSQLSGWLKKDGLTSIAGMDSFVLDDVEYARHLASLSGRPDSEKEDAAAFRCLTFERPAVCSEAAKPEQIILQQDQLLKAHSEQVKDVKEFHRNLSEQLDHSEEQIRLQTKSVQYAVENEAAEAIKRHADLCKRVLQGTVDVQKDVEQRFQLMRQRIEATADGFRLQRALTHTRARKEAWIRFGVIVALLLILITLTAVKGHAQGATNPDVVVTVCGTPPSNFPAAGVRAPGTIDTNGDTCIKVVGSITIDTSTPLAISAAANSYAVGSIPPSAGVLISGAITTAMVATTSTQVIAGTGSNYQYINYCITSNSSLTVSTDINLQDGSGGTVLAALPVPAGTVASTGGSGGMFVFPSPLKVTTSGNGLFAANVTTGSSTKITCGGFRSTVSY
jgi:hypothetical protein